MPDASPFKQIEALRKLHKLYAECLSLFRTRTSAIPREDWGRKDVKQFMVRPGHLTLEIETAKHELLRSGFKVPDSWLTVSAVGRVVCEHTAKEPAFKVYRFEPGDQSGTRTVCAEIYAAITRLEAMNSSSSAEVSLADESTTDDLHARDALLTRWYETKDTETYHRYKWIEAKWRNMPIAERAAVCPVAPNALSRDGIKKAIQRYIKKRDGNKAPSKPKRGRQRAKREKCTSFYLVVPRFVPHFSTRRVPRVPLILGAWEIY